MWDSGFICNIFGVNIKRYYYADTFETNSFIPLAGIKINSYICKREKEGVVCLRYLDYSDTLSSFIAGSMSLCTSTLRVTMKIKKIWFENDQIYGRDENGQVYNQSLLWYPSLRAATAAER